ncbi:MAG: REP-associated tyrosine transposase [Candidatus Binataceae bacterium]
MMVQKKPETSQAKACATNFQPVDPWKTEELAVSHRNLPHLEASGATYFTTFRCRHAVNLAPQARDIVMAVFRACNGKTIELDAAVVMPDHVHAIFRLAGSAKLSEVLRQIKGLTARRINQSLGGTGSSLWLDESFDHIIRQEDEWQEKIEYIRNNPVKRKLVSRPEDYPWLFAREITG